MTKWQTERPKLSDIDIIQALYDAEQTDLCKFVFGLLEAALRGDESPPPKELIEDFLETCYWA